MDGTGERTCDPDKDRISNLTTSIQLHLSQLDTLISLNNSCAGWWLQELREIALRLAQAVKPPIEPDPAFCEHCPADGSPCGVCGGVNGVKPDYSDEPAEGEY